jgi:hypothetical protein
MCWQKLGIVLQHGGEISICRPINWGYSLLIDSIPVHRGKERMRLHLFPVRKPVRRILCQQPIHEVCSLV